SDPPGTGAGLAHQAARHRTGHAVVRAADGRAAAVALRRADAPARCAGRGAARRWETTHGLPARRPARRSPGGAAAVDAARNPPMTTLLPRELLLPLTAELRKVLTLRWCVLLAALLPAIALVAATVTALMAGQADPRAQPVTGAATIGLLLAIAAAALGAGSFAAALTGGEFRYGTMPVTVLTAPDRDRLVGAKLLVAAALALAVGVVTELVALGCLFAFGRDKVTFDGTLWAVLGAGLFATVCWALIGTGLGLLLRNSTTAVTALLGWLLIGEPLI